MQQFQPTTDPNTSASFPGSSQDDTSLTTTGGSTDPVTPRIDPLTGRLFWFFAMLAGLLLLRFFVPYFAGQISYAITHGRQRAEVETAVEGQQKLPLRQLSKAFELVSNRVGPSVVHINVLSIEQLPNDEFASIFGSRRPQTQGQGSGVIVDESGFIVTNNHVVRGARRIEVTLTDGRKFPATVIGHDAPTDLAVLKVSADKLIPAEWGDSNELQVGALVWAVGSPFGLQSSITFGILSAKNREAGELDFLQTDAAVNPGNSGGALVDARGRLVGINTAILGESYQGISFAIPSAIAKSTYERLRSDGHLERGWLGVSLESVDEQVAREWNLGVSRGALVRGIAAVAGQPSPADQAGILPGDIIISWNGESVHDTVTLIRLVAGTEVGSSSDVTVFRRGQELTLQVVVGKRPRELD